MDGKDFRGIKFRYTNGLVNSGHMAPIFMQVSELSDEEMPREKSPRGVETIEVKGLVGDGSVNLESTSIGFVAFSRKGAGVEKIMFEEYEKL